MAVREHALGPFYVASVEINQRRCPLHTVDIIEEHRPWRRGKALLVSHRRFHALVLGLWRRHHMKVASDLEDAQWIEPRLLSPAPHEISEWPA